MRWFRYRPAAGRVSLLLSRSRVHPSNFILLPRSLLYHWPDAASSFFVCHIVALAALPSSSSAGTAARVEPSVMRVRPIMSLQARASTLRPNPGFYRRLSWLLDCATLGPLVIGIIIICTFPRAYTARCENTLACSLFSPVLYTMIDQPASLHMDRTGPREVGGGEGGSSLEAAGL